MRLSALIFFLAVTVLSLSGAETDLAREQVARIKNADVNFQGEYPGIVDYLSGASADVMKIGAGAVPFLYPALQDPNRYIAAHVLLTHLVVQKWEFSAKHWNHLVIDGFGPASDRTVKDQRTAIAKFWAEQRNPKKAPNP